MALRVVYFLERRKLQDNGNQGSDDYDGFKMFDMFSRYPVELEEFLRERNTNLLIIYLTKTKSQDGSNQEAELNRYQRI